MPTPKDLVNAKAAYDHAWAEATKYGDEMLEALQMHEKIEARETSDTFLEKAKRASQAYESWRKSAELAGNVMAEIYSKGFNYYK